MKCLVYTETEISAVKENIAEVLEIAEETMGGHYAQLLLDAVEVIEGGVSQEGFNHD